MPRPTLRRTLVPLLLLLLLSVWTLSSCTTRRRGSRSDDDDAADDDDASGDDDDSGVDDDDATGDDDDTPPPPGVLQLSADLADLGAHPALATATSDVRFENVGGVSIVVNLSLSDNSGTWSMPSTVVNVAPFTVEDRVLTFTAPQVSGTYTLTLNALHDGSNPSPQQLVFTATSQGSETNCSDGVDNNNNGAIDCYDQACDGDPACSGVGGDPCCGDNFGWEFGPCWVPTHEACVCKEDVFCCSDWDGTCADIYDGSQGSCGASGTCD